MQVNVKLLIGQGIGVFLGFALALFLSADTIAWPAGWIFLGLFFGFFLFINAWLFKHNPGLLQERTRFLGTPDQRGWDKVLSLLIWVLCFAWLILMPLDAIRFQWSQVPFWLQAGGVAILLCSFYLLFLVLQENSYLSPVVRVQTERGQTVISTGRWRIWT